MVVKVSSASSSTSSLKRKSSQLNMIYVMMFVGILVVSLAAVSSGRYLPTRSDNSRKERIKDVLRLLLEMAEGNDGGPNPYQQLRGEPLYDYQMDGGKLIPTGNMIAKRSVASVRSPFLQDHQQQEHQNREQKTAA